MDSLSVSCLWPLQKKTKVCFFFFYSFGYLNVCASVNPPTVMSQRELKKNRYQMLIVGTEKHDPKFEDFSWMLQTKG